MLVNHIWLVDVEDLDVVRQSLATYFKITASKRTVAWNLVKLDVIADLCEVYFFVQHKCLSQQLVWLLLEAINNQVVLFKQKLSAIDRTTVSYEKLSDILLIVNVDLLAFTINLEISEYVIYQVVRPQGQKSSPVTCDILSQNFCH